MAARRRLLLPCCLAPVAETAMLLAWGPSGSAALGPQITAPPPFDLFHDLRWISVYHDSWAVLGMELAAVVCLRGLWSAWVVRAGWPKGHRPPPSLGFAFLRALVFYAVACVVLAPFVVLLFGLALTHVSYLFFVAIPPVLAIALVIHRGALSQAAGQWWRWHPRWRTVGWLMGAFGWLSAAGAVISAAPWPLALVAAAGAGVLNARAHLAIVASISTPPTAVVSHRMRLAVPVALVTTFVLVAAGTRMGFTLTTPAEASPEGRAAAIPSSAVGHPVLVASGFNSRSNALPPLELPNGFVAWRFSYRGLDPERRPRAYGPADTLQPLFASARAMAAEVDALRAAYREPVTILAESEGALVARTYLGTLYRRGSGAVDRLVIFDMPTGPPGVYYPARGAQGWGVGTGWGLRGLALVIRALGPLEVSADAPFVRDLAECRTLIGTLTTDPAPAGVRQVSFLSLADAVDGPTPRGPFTADTFVITAPHGGLVGRPGTGILISEILAGQPDRTSVTRLAVARAITALTDAWHTPDLAEGLAPPGAC